MKISVENWGPIQKCEYDLDKSMIVTYGENNIGKSYAMQVMYLLLKKLLIFVQNRALVVGNGFFYRTEYKELGTIVEELVKDFVLDERQQQKEITEVIISMFQKKLTAELLPALHEAFENTFGTYEEIKKENPKIIFELDEKKSLCFEPGRDAITVQLDVKPVWLKKVESNFHKARDNKTRYDVYVYMNYIDTPIQLIIQRFNKVNRAFALKILQNIHSVYFLPASRSGIYTGMNSFGPVLALLSQNRANIRTPIQIPSISEPISDYYLELTTIKPDTRFHYADIASEIEDKVLHGEVGFDTKKKTITYTSQATGKTMEMGDVSSMVSEISPVTAYLKYIVRNQTQMRNSAAIIFIEEPEAHLHPKNQVALIKSFAKLTGKNIKLVMASHSNYVFNELNNLVLAKELDRQSYSPILMKVENGKSNTYYMEMDEWGVSDENFADIAEEIYTEREEIINKLLMEAEQKGENDTSDS